MVHAVQVSINGEVIGEFDSHAGATFNALGIQGDGVDRMTFASVNLDEDEWISLLEVGDACCNRKQLKPTLCVS